MIESPYSVFTLMFYLWISLVVSRERWRDG